MIKLPFALKEFCRPPMWVLKEAEEYWSPIIGKIQQDYDQIERISVAYGLRKSCLQFVNPVELDQLTAWCLDNELIPLILEKSSFTSDPYRAGSVAYQPGSPFQYRVAITRPNLARKWNEAWKAKNNLEIGLLLSFPSCCCDFFNKVWVEEDQKDTTWAMAVNTVSTSENVIIIPSTCPVECNILLRWLGVRAVSHLPCSFKCEPTHRLGASVMEIARSHGLEETVDWIYHMLNWPIEWSALHGLLELKTPVLKILASTISTADLIAVQKEGTTYPKYGATGIKFPFKKNPSPAVTEGKTFQLAFGSPSLWKENGFTSKQAMIESHQPIKDCFSEAVALRSDVPSVLDLGCGNGELLFQLSKLHLIKISGVELLADRLKSAILKMPLGNFQNGRIAEISLWKGNFDFILLMPGRLLEIEDLVERERVRMAILERATRILMYGYLDNLTRYGDLFNLVKQAGFPAYEMGKIFKSNIAAAAMLEIKDVHRLEEGSKAST